jgi:cyclophilin family peptidyl-prolyl cis-trans isomerase
MKLNRRLSLSLIASTLLLPLAGCGGGGGSSNSNSNIPPATTPVTLTVTHKVRITTSLGDIDLGLDRTHAPITVDNFLKYVNDGFYKSTIFHRVISNFVIQGGGVIRTSTGLIEKPTTYPAIQIESNNGLLNVRGNIAMARTSLPNSATSQFFINTVDNKGLDYPGTDGFGYTVFGTVTAGLDVVDKIRAVATTSQDVPVQDVVILDVKVLP